MLDVDAARGFGRNAAKTRHLVGAAVITLAAVGLVLRVVILRSEVGALDGDEAAWGTMARHVLDGEFSAFFWGQNYGGTQEVVLTAGVFALTGAGTYALRVVPMLLFLTGAVLTWRVGIRTVGEPYARLGAAAFWAWSPYVLWKSTRAHGFYGAGVVLGLVVTLLALRLAERPGRRDAVLLGLAFGLAWWATPQALVLSGPAVVWLGWRRRDLLRHAWLPAAAALVGALPWLVANLRHDWYSLSGPPAGGTATDRLHNLASSTLPSALGLRLPFTLDWVLGPVAGWLLFALALFALALVAVLRRKELGPLALSLLLFPLAYAVAPYAWLTTEPRYLVFLGPVLALTLVAAAGAVRRGVAVACALGALSIVGVGELARRDPPVVVVDGIAMPADIDPVLRALETNGIRHAWASYWIAWRIVFQTGERTIAVPQAPAGRPDEQGRYPRFYARVAESRDAAYVFLRGSNAEPARRRQLLADGYRPRRAGDFLLYVRR
jgi:hypothetical protein